MILSIEAPCTNMAISAPATMPATKVGMVGFLATISAITTTTGSSSQGLSTNVFDTVPRMSSYTWPPTVPLLKLRP